ncbi:hypothetical protein ABTC76_19955, partial [Acinetobacter baumannii]
GVENQEVAATVKPLLKEYRIALAVVKGLTRRLLRGRIGHGACRVAGRLGLAQTKEIPARN